LSRVKRGVIAHQAHKSVLALTKGHRATSHSLFRRANESMLHALHYAYMHRKTRKRDFRRLWIIRINAAARAAGITYGRLIDGLNKAGVDLDRKVMADLAVRDMPAFMKLVDIAKAQVTA
jgi:large subunit ribosomal protein L20